MVLTYLWAFSAAIGAPPMVPCVFVPMRVVGQLCATSRCVFWYTPNLGLSEQQCRQLLVRPWQSVSELWLRPTEILRMRIVGWVLSCISMAPVAVTWFTVLPSRLKAVGLPPVAVQIGIGLRFVLSPVILVGVPFIFVWGSL